ncbi:MAG TPA: MBL fold metallo-hydrolase, partial [Trebonia sp.]
MTYTGDVRVGGPSDTREIDGGVTLTKIAVGDMHNNAYLLVDRTGQGLLIDAAAEPARLLEMIGDTPVVKIVTTHQHADHWQALAEVKAATKAVTVAHPADAPGIPVPTDELVEDGGTIEFGDTRLHVTQLVGHTPGSIALTLNAAG